MSCIALSGKPASLHALLQDTKTDGLFQTPTLLLQLLVDVSKGLQFIHSSGFLHNDIKLDNIVLGSSITKPIRAYIIDFGKACMIGNGKHYSLSSKEVALYKKEHSHITPDLRNGLIAQCEATDIFSLGRVIRKVNRTTLHLEKLAALGREAMNYYSGNRPSIMRVLQTLLI